MSPNRHVAEADMPHDSGYEWRAVSLLTLGCSMVGLDRFVINPLFPVISKDLGLNYGHLGLIAGVLSLFWGLSALFSGSLSDRHGPRRVIVPAMLVFSLLAAATGLTSGLVSLLFMRGMMGIAEGAYMPAAIHSTADASKPSRIGLNMGILQMAIGLFGLGLGPVIATQMLSLGASWQWVLIIVAAPGLFLAGLLFKALRTPPSIASAQKLPEAAPRSQWKASLGIANVRFATLAMSCWSSAMVTLSAFMPSYLTDHLHLGLEQMGFVLSAFGAGSVVGVIGLGALSDRLGRKRVICIASAGLVAVLFGLQMVPAVPYLLAGLLLLTGLLVAGVLTVTVGAFTVNSVPPQLAATATGMVMGIGEIVGGALIPALVGGAAESHGIQQVVPITIGIVIAGLVVAIFGMREPMQADLRLS